MSGCSDDDFTVLLKYEDITSGTELPYAVPRPVDLLPVDSLDIVLRLPDGLSPDPLVGSLTLGNTGEPIYFLLNRSRSGARYYDQLYLDLNKDHDFTTDGPPYLSPGHFIPARNRHYQEFDRVAIPYEWRLEKTVTEEPFLCRIYFWYPERGLPATARVVRQGWRHGTFTVRERVAHVFLSDDDCNGIYDSSDRWALIAEDSLGTPYPAPFSLFRNLTRLGWLENTAFEVVELSPRGDRMKLRIKPVEWTREDDFARDNPYAGESRRPRAARDITWQDDPNRGMALARSIKKPVMLYFATSWSGPCKVMEERTFRDAEVVALSDGFVCIRIDGDRQRNLVERYRVSSYPTVVILDPRGRQLSRLIGYHSAAEFVAFLTSSNSGS